MKMIEAGISYSTEATKALSERAWYRWSAKNGKVKGENSIFVMPGIDIQPLLDLWTDRGTKWGPYGWKYEKVG